MSYLSIILYSSLLIQVLLQRYWGELYLSPSCVRSKTTVEHGCHWYVCFYLSFMLRY